MAPPSVPKTVKLSRDPSTDGNVNDLLRDISSSFKTQMTGVDQRLRTLESLINEKAAGLVSGLADYDGKLAPENKFSMLRAVRGVAYGEWAGGEYEREAMAEGAKARAKAMGHSDDSAGGFIVPPEVIPELIELLRAKSVVQGLGATAMNNLTGNPVIMPRHETGATAYWVAENSAITASDLAFGQIHMTPHKLAALAKVSNELIRLSDPSADAVIRRDFAEVIALEEDVAALKGIGAAGQPLGVANHPDIFTAVNFSSGDINFAGLLNFVGQVEDANAHQGSLGFATHPAVIRALKLNRAEASGNGVPFTFTPVITNEAIESQTGYKWAATTQLAGGTAAEIIFGAWQELLIGRWGGIEIMASKEAGDSTGGAFTSDQTWIRIIELVDFQVRHGASFAFASDVDSTAASEG